MKSTVLVFAATALLAAILGPFAWQAWQQQQQATVQTSNNASARVPAATGAQIDGPAGQGNAALGANAKLDEDDDDEDDHDTQ